MSDMNMNETKVTPKCQECGDEDYVIEVCLDSDKTVYWCMTCLQDAISEEIIERLKGIGVRSASKGRPKGSRNEEAKGVDK
jgi:DNA-directed RNA polymerase subunit RPC12/RpoP